MSLSSMFIGRQGIATHQRAIDLTTNNIANVNSIAFKKSTIGFGTGVANVDSSGSAPSASSGGVNGRVYASGATVESVSTNFTQGSLKQVGNTSTLALNGHGFFVVSPTNNVAANERNEFIYTRDGTFNIDAEGNLVNSAGQFVMGAMFYNETTDEMKSIDNSNYKSVTYLSDQKIGSSIDVSTTPSFTTGGIGLPGFNTSKVSELSIRSGILDPSTTIGDGDFSVTQENDLFRFTFTDTSGSIAAPNDVFTATLNSGFSLESKSNTFILKNGAGQEIQLRLRVKPEVLNIAEVFTGFSFDPSSGVGSSLTFDSAKDSTATQVGNSVTMDAADLPYITSADMDGLIDKVKLPPIFFSPDPESEVILSRYYIDQDGTVSIESNQTKGKMQIGCIMLANFKNYDGLINNGSGYYSPSANSGEACLQLIGGPSTDKNLKMESTQIVTNTLEYSNVDLAQEMTKMIAYQRGLQGNARVVTVANELLGTLMQM